MPDASRPRGSPHLIRPCWLLSAAFKEIEQQNRPKDVDIKVEFIRFGFIPVECSGWWRLGLLYTPDETPCTLVWQFIIVLAN